MHAVRSSLLAQTPQGSDGGLLWLVLMSALLLAAVALICFIAAVAYWVHAYRTGKRSVPTDLDSTDFDLEEEQEV